MKEIFKYYIERLANLLIFLFFLIGFYIAVKYLFVFLLHF